MKRLLLVFAALALLLPWASLHAQQAPAQDDSAGPQTDTGPIILPKKKESDEPPPPPAPAEPKVKNPDNAIYSMRVDVPMVNLDVNVLLDKTHQFVPSLKAENFLVLEDGVEQEVQTVRVTQTPITAVMLLEFAANNYSFIHDMQNSAATFFRSLKPDDYIAVVTYDIRSHILTDFTNNKQIVAQALQSLIMPTFRETNLFDALYETLDRATRIDGRKYIILIGSGRDSFSRVNLDKMLAKIKATPNVTIFAIGTGQLARNFAEARSGMGGMGGGMASIDYQQADNQMKYFASMTGGLSFFPVFEGALPDVFSQINDSIRNQYVLTYRPTNTATDGKYRKIKVLLVDKEGRPLRMQDEKGKALKYSVIARDGYTAKLPVE